MGKQQQQQPRSKKPNNGIGKGKVTPMQVAFIVDRYLSDNNFSQTRSTFRQEAASLISNSPVQEAPKTLLTLDAILNEYIALKEQKVIVEQEKSRLDQEKIRVNTLLQTMQDAMGVYNSSCATPPPHPPLIQSVPAVPQSTSGYNNVYKTPAVIPTVMAALPSNTTTEKENFTPTVMPSYPLTRKRCLQAVSGGRAVSKRTRSNYGKGSSMIELSNNSNPIIRQQNAQTSSGSASVVHTSTVAKCLFNRQNQSTPSNSPGPKTPQRSIVSQNDKSISPKVRSVAYCSNDNTPCDGITPTNCTVISSSERIVVSPLKNGTYYSVERRHCISSSPAKTPMKRLGKREHVKGRLDFDRSDVAASVDPQPITEEISTSESDKDADANYFNFDLPNLDSFGPGFSLSELMVDLGFDCDQLDFPSEPTLGAVDTNAGSSPESGDNALGSNQVMSELSSSVKEMFSEHDDTMQGQNTVTEVKSMTKCIRILSPVKGGRSSLNQQSERD
ncbi:hypothetical protein ACFE04_002550 [Oxalis oulophora]